MAKDDLASFDGRVTDFSGGGRYSVLLDNGHAVSARLCGKMKKFRIRVVVGDRVTVGVSPYDLTNGLILLRHKI